MKARLNTSGKGTHTDLLGNTGRVNPDTFFGYRDDVFGQGNSKYAQLVQD